MTEPRQHLSAGSGDEREITCAGCGGDGCVECAERGFYCAEFEPITMEDLESALRPFAEIALERDTDPGAPDMISGVDLAITPAHVRAARKALGWSGR